MSADGIVGFTRDQNVLAVSRSRRRLRIAHLGGSIALRQIGEDDWHYGFLPEGFDNLLRGIGKQGRFLLVCFFQTARERSRYVDGVRVGEQKPTAAGLACAGGDRVVLAGPTAG